MSKGLWPECYRTPTFLENRLPTRSNNQLQTPYELVYGKKPDLSVLRMIGSVCYVYQAKPTTRCAIATCSEGYTGWLGQRTDTE